MANYAKMGEEKLRAELVKRGFDEVELKELTKEQLIAQIEEDNNKPAEEVDEKAESVEDETVAAEQSDEATALKGKKSGVTAILKGEKLVRTYSVEKHGKDVQDLVTTFLSKDAGYSAVDASKIARIEVRWRAYDTTKGAYTEKSQSFTNYDQALSFAKETVDSACVVTMKA